MSTGGEKSSGIPLHWLVRRATPEEFERSQLERTAEAFKVPLEKVVRKFADRPFGQATADWREFVKQMEDGDELWSFHSPAETWAAKCGRLGYAIVREGTVRRELVMLQN